MRNLVSNYDSIAVVSHASFDFFHSRGGLAGFWPFWGYDRQLLWAELCKNLAAA